MSNILVFSAHAADFCSRAGGTIIKYINKGYTVHIIDLTYGETGESAQYWNFTGNPNVEDCKKIRRNEAEKAAAVMGATIEFMDYDDYPLIITRGRIKELSFKIQKLRPEIILTHWDKDTFNEDHATTSRAVISAVTCATVPGNQPGIKAHIFPDIFFFESSVPHTEFNEFRIDHYIDITDVYDKKVKALECFVSQPFLIEFYEKYALQRAAQAVDWTKNNNIIYAEGFKRFVPWVGDIFPQRKLISLSPKYSL
ncbi:MAG: PIG-L family deacetylase [Candidatus Atribacteria bacterium]|nr:PIG-L family deacetylase [Candidatus Atribacteria bacterium]